MANDDDNVILIQPADDFNSAIRFDTGANDSPYDFPIIDNVNGILIVFIDERFRWDYERIGMFFIGDRKPTKHPWCEVSGLIVDYSGSAKRAVASVNRRADTLDRCREGAPRH